MRVSVIVVMATAVFLVTAVEEKNRGKRQQVYYTRRGGRPPPYAVQMEPIVQYSQRDPLYNPLANSKSDDDFYHDESLSHSPYGSEPEPIIEIIIKESNESLPTPVPPPALSSSKPTKEPIQVFYVKYEKKDQGNGKSKVVYEKPIPALTPHEEHEEINSDNQLSDKNEPAEYVTQSPLLNEPSTTLRAIIRPDSEVYHSDGSGIKITFGSDKLPPNNHNKRSDRDNPNGHPPLYLSSFSPSPSISSPHNKRQHGPFPAIQPNHRLPPAPLPPLLPPQSPITFPQQRINSFQSQQQQQQLPPNFSPPPQFQSPSPLINVQRPPQQQQQRLPITIQGLPEVHQRFTFQSFGSPAHGIRINHPQQPGFPPAVSVSHQSLHVQNQPSHSRSPSNFNGEQQQQQQLHQRYQQQHQQQQLIVKQEHEKQKYQELKQREQYRQQELQHQQEQQYQERQRLQSEQQRFKQQENKIREQYSQQQLQQSNYNRIQQQQQQQQQQLQQQQQQRQQLQQHQQQIQQQQQQQQEQKPAEILKAVPKLEQHYAIRENPLHPGPFPPNPQLHSVQYSQTTQNSFPSHQQQATGITIQKQTLLTNPSGYVPKTNSQTPAPKFPNYQKDGYFGQTLPNIQSQQSSFQYQSIWNRSVVKDPKQKIFATPVPKTENSAGSSIPRFIAAPTTTSAPPTTTTEPTTTAPTTSPPKNEAKIKQNIANLPDEVPDDIRDQLLSSGILGNADIQVLDYDKVGDIPIENLPPEALANFYGAGGGAVAASAPIPSIAKRPKIIDDTNGNNKNINSNNNNKNSVGIKPNKVMTTTTKVEQATLKPGGVEMKVVHFDPNTAQGQAIADQHIRDDATHLKPVNVVNSGDDNTQYNRYLPLKVSGASFPIPDVPELKDRKISSVVVLAPVDYNFRDDEQQSSRYGKKVGEPMPAKFLAGDTLKQLIRKPSAENYKKWLEQESQTEPQKQSVVLLVTTPRNPNKGEKEIFMYDVSSQGVSKLSGDLSSAFVDAAESNSESSDSIDDSSFTS
ncbi:putative uncharacterized protein DDB_G0271606 [Microplitis demolitor]|uniref:putative uncharacterized protein DDB_G0271606 n=1 Tax=Microplitis demolitor TaxID=69319 RepID=UPI00043FFFF7|nr:putative uncharacterized protein DDB_G0271606 [Microplitis demolitor]